MAFRWKDEHMILFLELYKNHECLWNTKCDKYHKINIREQAFQLILNNLKLPGLTVTDLKSKIKTIRTRYCAELAKIKKSERSGAGIENVYKPRLFWFKEADSFLRSVCIPKESSSNMKKIPNKKPDSKFDLIFEDSNTEFDGSQNIDSQNKETTEILIDNHYSQKETAPHVIIPLSSNQKGKRKSNDNMESIQDAISKLQKLSDENKASKINHELDVFCNSLAIQLKKMPLHRAFICQEKLQAVMTQERISQLFPENCRPFNQSSSYSTYTLTPSPADNFEDSSQHLLANNSEIYTSQDLHLVTQAVETLEN